MAEEKKYPYAEAVAIAYEVVQLLKPHCLRVEIAGSIRRQKKEVKDVEIVAIPKPYETGLFADGIASVVNQWQKVKGELSYGVCKYTQRILPQGIKLDLFFATHDNWGNVFLIRTGDADFSKKVMGTLLPQNGYKQEGGYLKYNNKIIPCPEETDVFMRAALPYLDPIYRSLEGIRKLESLKHRG